MNTLEEIQAHQMAGLLARRGVFCVERALMGRKKFDRLLNTVATVAGSRVMAPVGTTLEDVKLFAVLISHPDEVVLVVGASDVEGLATGIHDMIRTTSPGKWWMDFSKCRVKTGDRLAKRTMELFPSGPLEGQAAIDAALHEALASIPAAGSA